MHIFKSKPKKSSQKRTLSKTKPSVDPVQWSHRGIEEDPRIPSLKRIIRWQSRTIILLLILLGASVAMQYFHIEFKLPNQEAVTIQHPFSIETIDYYSVAYQGSNYLEHGTVVTEPNITVIGQLYDGDDVLKSWPDFTFYINNKPVPLTGPQYQFRTDLSLVQGPNVIETAFSVDGVLRDRRQRVITYAPKE